MRAAQRERASKCVAASVASAKAKSEKLILCGTSALIAPCKPAQASVLGAAVSDRGA
jgi:hypothetical protein